MYHQFLQQQINIMNKYYRQLHNSKKEILPKMIYKMMKHKAYLIKWLDYILIIL